MASEQRIQLVHMDQDLPQRRLEAAGGLEGFNHMVLLLGR